MQWSELLPPMNGSKTSGENEWKSPKELQKMDCSAFDTHDSSFCPQCGAILSVAGGNQLKCDSCGHSSFFESFDDAIVKTASRPKPKPLWLKEYEGQKTQTAVKRQTVSENCPKCGNKIMEFYTLQLRSVDEGQTVFYECPECSHKYSLNT